MTQPLSDTHVDEAGSQGGPIPLPEGFGQPAPPSPANMPRPQQPQAPQQQPQAPHADDGDDGDSKGSGKKLETIEDYKAALEKTRKESAARRVKLNEYEPIVQQHKQAEEAQKTELQREREAREAAEKRDRDREENFNRLDVAVKLGIDPDNIDLIGPGSREEMEQRALRIKAMQDAQAAPGAPPSDRPVEGLRPGASPEPPKPADDSYPAAWTPNHIRDRENENRRTQYGQ
jgi:hypothetical protein